MKIQLQSSLALLLLSIPLTQALAAQASAPRKDYKHMAIAYAQERSGFQGWSAGVGLGVNTYMVNTTSTTTTVADESPFLSGGIDGNLLNNYGRASTYKYGAMGNLFFGYGYMRDIYYGGFDAGVNIVGANSATLSQENNSSVTTVGADSNIAVVSYVNNLDTKTKVSRGWAEPFIDLKLGGLITPETLAYVRGGVSYNRATIKSSSSLNSSGNVDTIFGAPPATPSAVSSSSFGYSQNKNLFGVRLGAGMEVLLTPKFGVAADYIYSFYQTFNTSGSAAGNSVTCDTIGGCAVVATTLSTSTRTVLSDQQVMAKFIYHLG